MGKTRFSTEEKVFFTLVTDAATANPFSDERTEIDYKIAGLFPGVADDERLDRTIAEVGTRIQKLIDSGRGTIDSFSGEDVDLAKNAFAFDVFHQYLERFDALIVGQMADIGSNVKLPFAAKAIASLCQRGIDPREAHRFISLFFQLRRAFFFIDKSLVGRSPCMKSLRQQLWNNIFTSDMNIYHRYLWNRMEDFSTMMLGETGTGKGTAAAAVGRSGYIPFDDKSGRFMEKFPHTFIPLNLSQFSETLIESELFGHRKGAFTGAMDDHTGVFDRCSAHGSIFLDEIGELSEPVQIKLLQVLQERTFSPVGSHEVHRFQGRVIAATNRPIHRLRGQSGLREDFYYRLCSDVIVVPPLRQRIREDPSELDDLLRHTMKRLLGEEAGELVKQVRSRILATVGLDYAWPGNVRELEQCVRRILIGQDYRPESNIRRQDLTDQLKAAIEKGNLDARGLLTAYCRILYQRQKTYESVARTTGLDRRTVKKYID
ncbi:MAG: sigma-54-dependent Fis family transcriptional regulator [Desulfobacteraceae bacterium]|nr:sigma-54-dependent Fis family transcriptional regulator [Desulfobacteraceae bacterium]